jgi:predicted metal-dependent hydrolase
MRVAGISVDVVRKGIKNLHIGVYPPNGRVRVAAPQHLDDQAIRLALISRLAWIKRQQRVFIEQKRQSQREMVTGESHFYQGQRYRLNVIEENVPPSVRIANSTTIELRVRPKADRNKREAVLHAWYRSSLKETIPGLVEKWERRMDLPLSEWRIKKMKTLWGSCNPEARRVWLNLELAKKPRECLEYVLVHEMVHLLERHHNQRFVALMDQFMPQWRAFKDMLNRAPLAHEEWKY